MWVTGSPGLGLARPRLTACAHRAVPALLQEFCVRCQRVSERCRAPSRTCAWSGGREACSPRRTWARLPSSCCWGGVSGRKQCVPLLKHTLCFAEKYTHLHQLGVMSACERPGPVAPSRGFSQGASQRWVVRVGRTHVRALCTDSLPVFLGVWPVEGCPLDGNRSRENQGDGVSGRACWPRLVGRRVAQACGSFGGPAESKVSAGYSASLVLGTQLRDPEKEQLSPLIKQQQICSS